METLDIKKLAQAILRIRTKLMLCATIGGAALDEDEVEGLSNIIEECCDELEQAANSLDLLTPAGYVMKQRGRLLKAVPNPMTLPSNGNGNGTQRRA